MDLRGQKKGQVYLRHIQNLLTVAPFRAWRGSQPLIAQGLALYFYLFGFLKEFIETLKNRLLQEGVGDFFGKKTDAYNLLVI